MGGSPVLLIAPDVGVLEQSLVVPRGMLRW